MACWSERFRRVFKQFDEFNSLSQTDQMQVWLSSIIPTFALIVSKIESCTNISEQCAVYLADIDNRIVWEMSRQMGVPLKHPFHVQKFNKGSKIFPPEVAMAMHNAFTSVRFVTANINDTVFMSLLLFTLFRSSEEFCPHLPIGGLSRKYLWLLQKHESNHLTPELLSLALGNFGNVAKMFEQKIDEDDTVD